MKDLKKVAMKKQTKHKELKSIRIENNRYNRSDSFLIIHSWPPFPTENKQRNMQNPEIGLFWYWTYLFELQ